MREIRDFGFALGEQLFDTDGMAVPSVLRRQLAQIAPVVLAEEHVLPVADVFAPILPGAGLQRGWTIRVGGDSSARALGWALLGGITTAGGWIAAVNVPGIGLSAAQEVGVAIERVLVVNSPNETWSSAVGSLIGAVDVVVFGTPRHRVVPSEHRRMASRARERGSLLMEFDSSSDRTRVGRSTRYSSQLQYDLSFTARPVDWIGLGRGHGCLKGRALDVEAGGRRIGGGTRRAQFALPAPDGTIQYLEPQASVTALRSIGG